MGSFIIMENVEIGEKAYEFTLCKTKFSTPWMLVLDMVVEGKRFIEQHPAWLERINERGEEGAVQVKKDENGIVCFMPKRWLLRRLLQIEHSRTDTGEVSYSCARRKACEGLFIPIHRVDLVAQRGEE